MSAQERSCISSPTLPQSNTANQIDTEIVRENENSINSNVENFGKEQSSTTKQIDQTMRHESSSSEVDSQTHSSENDNKKRSHTKQLIERYFYQLTVGCGNSHCKNKNCASNYHFTALTPNQAAARAIKLFSEDAEFCNNLPSKTTPCITDDTESYTEPIPVNSQIFGLNDRHR